MKTQEQTGEQALVQIRLRQQAGDIRDAKTAERVTLRQAAAADRKQLAVAHRALAKAMRAEVNEQIKAMKVDLKEQFKTIAAELKVSINESNAAIAQQFREQAEQAAANQTLASSIAARDVNRSDVPVIEQPVTLTDALVALAGAA